MAPNEAMLNNLRKKETVADDLLIITRDKNKSKDVAEKRQKRKHNKTLKELWEKEQFIQIKGIQKTQEAVNRNLRQLQLDKLRITRNKRIEEASDNIRRRRETQHQQTALKDVLNKIQRGEDQLHDEHQIKEIYKGECNKEKKLINKNTHATTSDINIQNLHKRFVNNDSLPPLVHTRRKLHNITSIMNSTEPTSSTECNNSSENKDRNVKIDMNAEKITRSIVITIPDVNTDASHLPRSSRVESRSAASSSGSNKSDRSDHLKSEKEHDTPARNRLQDLPSIKFTLKGINGPPVSYFVDKDNMVSYRPSYGVPMSKLPDDKCLNPTMMVSPRNSSVSIPLVRKEMGKYKENLSIIGKNPQISPVENPQSFRNKVGRMSRYDILSRATPDSSHASSSTRRHSMRGSKKSKKKIKQTEISPKTNFTTNTGFVISEFSIQERLPRKTVVQMEKQALHEFPVHVRERYIKKKLSLAQSDQHDVISWKVRKYVTGKYIARLIRNRNCLTFVNTWTHSRCLDGCVLLIFVVVGVACFALFVFVMCPPPPPPTLGFVMCLPPPLVFVMCLPPLVFVVCPPLGD